MKKLVILLFILSTHAYSTSPCAHEWNRVKSWSRAERNTSTFLIPPVFLYSTALPILFPVSLGVTGAAAIAKGKYEFEKKKRKETFQDYEKCMMNHAKNIQNGFKNINIRLSEQQEILDELNEKFATASIFPISETHPRPRQETVLFKTHSTEHVPYSQTNHHRPINSISEAHPWVDFSNQYIDNSYASIKNLQKQTLEEVSTAKASLESFVRDLENIDQTRISHEGELEKRVQKTKQNYERWTQLRDQKQKILQKATEERSHIQARYRFVELSEKALLITRDFHFDQQWDLISTVMDYAQDALDFAIQPEDQFQYDLITGMTPGISWGRDVFEAMFGIDLITGSELSSVERSMAILGVVTAGTGNKVGRIAKIINKADDYMDRSENIENATDAIRHTEKVLDSARDKFGSSQGIENFFDIVRTDSKSAGVRLDESLKNMKHPKIWSDKKRAPSVKNAYGHWKKHGSEFPQYNNAIEYVEGAHSFAKNPPLGTMSKTKSNGDKVFYHQESNTFMIQASHDAPRTMFKPDPSKHGYATNLDYFNAQ